MACGRCQQLAGGPEPGSPTCQALTLPSPALQTLPPSGIHIFASQLHTHLTGRKVVTVLARDGREKEIVNRDDHYSPHFQVGAARASGPAQGLAGGLWHLLSPAAVGTPL